MQVQQFVAAGDRHSSLASDGFVAVALLAAELGFRKKAKQEEKKQRGLFRPRYLFG